MELCGDLIERVHENLNALQQQGDGQDNGDDQVAEMASEAKTQVRSHSSTDSAVKQAAASSKTNGSGPGLPNASRYGYLLQCFHFSSTNNN